MFKNISFHKTCKCACLLDKKVCNNLQRWNGNKCRCECLKIKKCNIGYSWNVNNCRSEIILILIKKVKDCKPFIGVSILFLCVSIILIGIMIYFYLKSKNNNILPY